MLKEQCVDVSQTAAEVGLGFSILGAPVFLTRKLWDTCVRWGEEDTEAQDYYQEQDARLWDVLFVCGSTIQMRMQAFLKTMTHEFSVYVVPRDGRSTTAVKASLVALGHPEEGILRIDLIELAEEQDQQW